MESYRVESYGMNFGIDMTDSVILRRTEQRTHYNASLRGSDCANAGS